MNPLTPRRTRMRPPHHQVALWAVRARECEGSKVVRAPSCSSVRCSVHSGSTLTGTMPSPIPVTRLLPKDLYPSLDVGTCSSPLTTHPHGSTLQVPPQRLHGRVSSRLWSSVIHWKALSSVAPVGSGGFGSVFRAEYLGETVALKKVKKCAKNPLASRQSFWAELNAAHLRHRNIVRVLAATACVPADLGDAGCIGTILMEFVGSVNLQQVIYGCAEPLGPDRWLRYAQDVARGLRFLHSHGVAHLDIKPANVLVSAQDVCKIADFGCSLKLERGCDLTATSPHLSHVGGTYTHRAPELLRGEPVSARADVYSFGITLWQLITREQPFTGDRQYVIYAVVARDLRPSVHERPAFQSDLGRLCRTLLGRCWSGEARSRPSAHELLPLLEQLRAHLPTGGADRAPGP